MWKQLGEFFRHVLFLTQEVQKSQDDIGRHEQELREVEDALKLLAFEVSKLRDNKQHDNEQHEREKMALRFEIELLRSGQQLSAGKPDEQKEL